MGRRGAVIVLRYVNSFTDRHGKQRHYFRRHGKRIALPGAPGSAAFMDAYAAALANEPARPVSRIQPAAPGSFRALAALYYASPKYQRLAPSTRALNRRFIDEFLREHGHRRVDQMTRAHVDAIVGKMADKPGAAIMVHRQIRMLLNYGIKLGMVTHNPASRSDTYKTKPRHTWTEAEIAQFEARWSVGTKARLAFAMLLYTGQRQSDVHRLAWPDAAGFHLSQQKTGTPLIIPVHPELATILAATKREHAVVLATAYGRPFTVRGLGKLLADAIQDAGLPARCVPHGLRKAMARRLAEGDATAKQIAAVTGHKTLSEVERYTAAANQPRLAQQAFEKQAANAGWQTGKTAIGKPVEIKRGK